jgi:hypothetical protein
MSVTPISDHHCHWKVKKKYLKLGCGSESKGGICNHVSYKIRVRNWDPDLGVK